MFKCGKFLLVSANVAPLDASIDRFISIPEAASFLSIHPVTANRLIREDLFPIPVRKVGGKRVVSLRRVLEYIDAADPETAA